jgi:hypothetical protein
MLVPWILTSGSYILGLAHPTGFPAEILFGWLFSHSFPFGTIAFRLTLLNAIEASVTGLLIYTFVRLEGGPRWLAAVSGLGFATTLTVWQHATHNDVMNAAVTFSAATFFLIQKWSRSANRRFLIAAGATGALAVGTHGATVLYLLGIFVALFAARRNLDPKAMMATLAVFLSIAAALYAYLPARAGYVVDHRLDPTMNLGLPPGRPFWDWGDPRTVSSFLFVVTGKPVSASSAALAALSPTKIPAEVGFARAQLASIVALPLFVVGALLVLIATVRRPILAALLIAPAVFVTPFIANFGAESDPQRYYIFPLWCLWVLASVGLSSLLAKASMVIHSLAAAAATVTLAIQVDSENALFQQRTDHLATSYVAAALRETPSNAVLIAQWTYATPLAYQAYVLGQAGNRIVVAGEAGDLAPRVVKWKAKRPVYAISESQPTLPKIVAIYVCGFTVNPDENHDPKLYDLHLARPEPSRRIHRRCGLER